MANTTQMDPEELLKQIRQGTTVSSAPDQADPEEILRQVRGASPGQNTTTAAEPGVLETANKYWEPTPAIKPALSWNYAKNLGTRVGEGAMRGALMIPNIAEATREAVVTPPKNAEEQKVSNLLNTDHEPIVGRVILAAKRLAWDPSVEARQHVAEEAAAAKAKLNAMGVKTEGDYDTLDPRAQQVRRAERLGQAVSSIPFVGPMGISMGEHVGKTGDVAGTVSELGTMAVMPEIQKGATDIAGRAVKAAAPVVADVAKNATSPIVRVGARGVDLALKHPKITAAILGSAGAAIGLPGHGTIPLVSELAGGALGGALFGKALSPEGGVPERALNFGLPEEKATLATTTRELNSANKEFSAAKSQYDSYKTQLSDDAIPQEIKESYEQAKKRLAKAEFNNHAAKVIKDAANSRVRQPGTQGFKPEWETPSEPEVTWAQPASNVKGPGQVQPETFPQEPTPIPRVDETTQMRPLAGNKGVIIGRPPRLLTAGNIPEPVNDPLAAMRFQGTLGGDETLPVPPPKGPTVSLEDKAKLREDYNTAKEKRNGVSKKLFVTKADEALLRDLGYTQEQINKLTPQKAGDILTRTETDANSPIVAEQLANVGNESLRRIAKSAGIDPDEYDFKLERGESRHHPDRDRLVAEIVNKMSPEELERHEFGAQDFEHNADQSQAMKKSRAEVLFKHRISGAPLDEFGNPTVSGSAPESDLDRTAEEHTKALFPGQKANVEAQESIPRAVSPEEAQRRADAYATVQYPRGVVPGARVLESSGLNVNPIHEINIGGHTGLVRMPGESGTSEVADQFLRQQYPNENAIVLPRETAGSSVYSPEEINEAANQHLKDYERSNAQHTYEKEPGELVTKHRVTVTDEHGNPIGKVEAVELTSEPGTWRIQSSESKATPGSHVGRDAYKQILDSAKAEAKETGSPITVLGDAVQSPSALATWRALGKEYGPVSNDYTTGRASITLSPEKSSGIPRIGELAKQLWEREHGELGKPESVGDEWHTAERLLSPEEKAKLNDATSLRSVRAPRAYWGDTGGYDKAIPDQSVEVGGGNLSLREPNEGAEESVLKRRNPFEEFRSAGSVDLPSEHFYKNPLGRINTRPPLPEMVDEPTPGVIRGPKGATSAERLGSMGATYEARPTPPNTKFPESIRSLEDTKNFVERMKKGVKPIKETIGEQTGKAGYSSIKEPPLRSKADAGPALGEPGYVRPPGLVEVPRVVRIPREMTEALGLPDQGVQGTATIPYDQAKSPARLMTINRLAGDFSREVPDVSLDLPRISPREARVKEVTAGKRPTSNKGYVAYPDMEEYRREKIPFVSTLDVPDITKEKSAEVGKNGMTRTTGTAFDAKVEELKLKPEQYEKSNKLKEWAEKNYQTKFVPEKLLRAWGLNKMQEYDAELPSHRVGE